MYAEALDRLNLLSLLEAFDPHVAGTPPLGLALPASDIDILCHAPDPEIFALRLWDLFEHEPDFRVWRWIGPIRPVVCAFTTHGWPIEIFGQDIPVSEQTGWRHFRIEQRLLALGGEAFRLAVLRLRRDGAKTEPAFAAALRLSGDPYDGLLTLESWSDQALQALIVAGRYPALPITFSEDGAAASAMAGRRTRIR